MDRKEAVRRQFASSGDAYVVSPTHASTRELDLLAQWCPSGPELVALDIATGGGHTARALAPLVGQMVVSDLTPQMLWQARRAHLQAGQTGHVYVVADAENLPFLDDSFDVVSCRVAPHHFPDVPRFCREVARVLRPGGTFLLVDSVAPDEPEAAAVLHHVELLHDPTHQRSLSRGEWAAVVESAALKVLHREVVVRVHEIEEWCVRSNTSLEAKAGIYRTLRAAPDQVRVRLQVVEEGDLLRFTDEKLVLIARKPG